MSTEQIREVTGEATATQWPITFKGVSCWSRTKMQVFGMQLQNHEDGADA